MTVIFPFCHREIEAMKDLLSWCGELDQVSPHEAVLLASSKVTDDQVKELYPLAQAAFESVHTIRQHTTEERPWPICCNALFRIAVTYAKQSGSPFFWNEPDCIPLKPGWLYALEVEYQKGGKPFMGQVWDKPLVHLTGCAVYPADISRFNPAAATATHRAWDVVRPELTVPHTHRTNLVQHVWGDIKTNTPPTFPDRDSLKIINPEAVVFHRCKDRTLIKMMREAKSAPVDDCEYIPPAKLRPVNGAVVGPVSRLNLPTVTLWACCWSDDKEMLARTVRVLNYCTNIIDFERVVLFSYLPPPALGFGAETIQIPKLNPQAWNIFVNRTVPAFIKSEFAMSVHEDGFPLDANRWKPEFLDYDYIGAPWTDGVVGNGGFNIESQKLMRAKVNLPFCKEPVGPSDFFVCRVHRKQLEQSGITFAPSALALEFSTETVDKGHPSFGFHGRKHSPDKYAVGWKLIEALEASPSLKVALVYIHVPGEPEYSKQFMASYRKFPPGYSHRTIVVCQGKSPGAPDRALFAGLPNLSFYEHDDSGFDIGAYCAVSKTIDDDVMLCCGGSTYFQREGWISRMVQAWRKHGPGMYGSAATYEVSPHINTTGFWCPPKLLAGYPVKVISRQERYDFEHGPNAFWKMVHDQGLPVKLVTWGNEYDWPDWRVAPNIFRRGDQSNCIAYWHHHRKYESASPQLKITMERNSDILTDPLWKDRLVTRGAISSMIASVGRGRLETASRRNFVRAHQGFV